jgi:hypothetical protein
MKAWQALHELVTSLKAVLKAFASLALMAASMAERL